MQTGDEVVAGIDLQTQSRLGQSVEEVGVALQVEALERWNALRGQVALAPMMRSPAEFAVLERGVKAVDHRRSPLTSTPVANGLATWRTASQRSSNDYPG